MSLALPFSLPSNLSNLTVEDLPDEEDLVVLSPFRFIVYPVLGGSPLGELELADVTFTEAVDGTGTRLEASAYLSDTQSADTLKRLLNYGGSPKAVAIYVKYDDRYYWGGVLQARPWKRDSRRFDLLATSWKAWLYERFLQPDTSVNPVVDIKYAWTSDDQFEIAKAIIGYATTGVGTPTISTGTETSGVDRDLTIFGSEFVTCGEAIDRMANRERGFEWDIEIRSDMSGNPSLYFAPSYPKRQAVNSAILLHSTPEGGNLTAMSDPDDTMEQTVTRVWGTGSGTAGVDLLMAYDQDPDVTADVALLEESKEYSNSSTVLTATIAGHVQAIRQQSASGIQQVSVEVSLIEPEFTLYNYGDKVRFLYRDEVLDLDFQSVRIVTRKFKLNASGDSPKEDSVELLIDLNDTELPQNEEVL